MLNTTIAGPQAFDRAVSDLKQGVATATAAHAEASALALKTAKDVASFNQGTLEACSEASKILATGSQDLFRQIAESSRSAFNDTVSGFQSLINAKSIKERLELQASLARTAATRSVSEYSRFAQAGIDLAEKAYAPLAARAVLAAEVATAAFKG